MASITKGLIEKVQIDNGTIQSIASTAYGVCTTAASEPAKTVEMDGFELVDGITVHIKFINENSAVNPTLSINNSPFKPIVQYGITAIGNDANTSGWQAGAIVSFTYDGVSWVRDQGYNTQGESIGGTSYIDKITSVDNAIVRFDGVDGAVQNSGILIDDNSNLIFPSKQGIYFRMNDKQNDGGQWAYHYIDWYDKANALFATLGVYGTDNTLGYVFLGSDSSESSDLNLRIAPNGTITGKLFSGSGASLTNLNASNISSGVLSTERLENSGATAGAYGPAENATLNYSSQITVPQVTVDVKGRVTGIVNKVLTLPASDNTDIHVTQSSASDNLEYPILMKYNNNNATVTNEVKFSHDAHGVTINPSTGTITATSFNGKATSAITADTVASMSWTSITNKPTLSVAGLSLGLDNNDHAITAAALRTALGLANALHFMGETQLIHIGEPTETLLLPNNYTPQSGDVWLVADPNDGPSRIEYIFIETDSTNHTGEWEKLGDESSYKLKQTAVTDSSIVDDERTGDLLSFVYKITQNEQGVITVTKADVPEASSTQAGVVSTSNTTQEFKGRKKFLDGLEVSTNSSSTDKIVINGNTIENIPHENGNEALYIQTRGGEVIFGDDLKPVELTNKGTAFFDGRVGINILPDTATTGDQHVLKVDGSTLFLSSLISMAHLDMVTSDNITEPQFYPHTTQRGSLGLINKRWRNLFIYEEAQIGPDENSGIYLDKNGTIAITTATNANIPIITLTANSGTSWDIKNTAGTFTIINNTNVTELSGSTSGFYLKSRLFINTLLSNSNGEAFYVTGNSSFDGTISVANPTGTLINSTSIYNGIVVIDGGVGISANVNIGGKVGIGIAADTDSQDPHRVTILGSVLFKVANNTINYNVAHFDVKTTTANNVTYGDVEFYPHTTNYGSIGISTNKWKDAYFYDSITVANTGSIVSSGDGSINITASTPIITFINGNTSWKIQTSTTYLDIASLAHVNTYIQGRSNYGFKLAPRVAINADVDTSYNFYVSGTTYITDITGIGVTPETGVQLKVNNYLKLTHSNTDIVHLKYESITGETSTLFFYPETNGNGLLGLEDHRWKALYVSDDFNITHNNGNSIDLSSATGTITLSTDYNINNQTCPSIILTTTDSSIATWTMTNDVGNFSLTNGSTVTLDAINGRGFKIVPRLYINADIDLAGTYNLYVTGVNDAFANVGFNGYVTISGIRDALINSDPMLTVQDYIKIIHESENSSVDIAHLKYYVSGSGANEEEHFVFMSKDRIGELGLDTNRWKSLYIYNTIEMSDEYNGNGTDYITISTDRSTGCWFHMDSDLNKAMIDMITKASEDVTITLTSTTANYESKIILNSANPSIILDTTTSGASDWNINNNEGILSITDGTRYINGSSNGFELNGRFYLNSTLDNNATYVFKINNLVADTKNSSMFEGYLGVGTDTDINRITGSAYLTVQEYFKLVKDNGTNRKDITHLKYNTAINVPRAEFYPAVTDTDFIGLTSNRWKDLYLSNILDIQRQVSNVTHAITLNVTNATVTLQAPTPNINLKTTSTTGKHWKIWNEGNVLNPALKIEETNSTAYLYGYPSQGWKIGPRLYVNADIPTTNTYALYINGEAHITGGINSSNDVFPTNHLEQSIGLPQAMWGEAYLYKISARYIDAAPQADNTNNYTLYIGKNALQETHQVSMYYTNSGAETEELRVNNNGVFALVRLTVGTSTVNSNYSLNVDGDTKLGGDIYYNGHIEPLVTDSYDIGSHNPANNGTTNMVRRIYSDTLSVRYIDAAPERHAGDSTIYVGYCNATVNNDHAITPTSAIKFYTSTGSTQVGPAEQMIIDSTGVAIRNTIQLGHCITINNVRTATDKEIKFQGTNTNDSMIRFLNNDGDSTGNGISIGGGGITIIGGGTSASNVLSNDNALTINQKDLYLFADSNIIIEAYAATPSNRTGITISQNLIIPTTHGVALNNTLELGRGGTTAPARWKSVFIGTADSYGTSTQPIYWSNGVPTPSDANIGTSIRGLYMDAGSLLQCAYTLEANIDDSELQDNNTFAPSLAYYSAQHTLTYSSIRTDGSSLYPTSTNVYSLGVGNTATGNDPDNGKRWKNVYIGTTDTYGDVYQPIYWNDGVPTITYPVQYFTWSINSGNLGTTLVGTSANLFTDDTYAVTIVVTNGEANLNAPLQWLSDNTNGANSFIIQTDVAVSGNVSGYAIVSRGRNITGFTTATQIVPPSEE